MKNNKFKIAVKWDLDEDSDLSYLGTYKSNRPNNAYVDRKNEVLIIPNRTEQKQFISEEYADDFINELNNLDIPFNSWIEESEDFEENPCIVEYPYYQELPYSCHFSKSDYQFIESFNYSEPSPDEYEYIVQDVKLLESYGNDWHMRVCVVSVSINGIELGSSSLGGLDSTMTSEDDQKIIEELTEEAITEAEEALGALKSA